MRLDVETKNTGTFSNPFAVKKVPVSMPYAHTLIPSDPGFVPHPNQVRDFVDGLRELEAAPIDPTLEVIFDVERIAVIDGKPLVVSIAPSGRRPVTTSLPRREGRNPATGEILIILRRDCTLPADTEALPSVLDQLEQYEFEMAGAGPAKVAVLSSDRNKSEESGFDFRLRCRLSWKTVSTSDYHGDQLAGGDIKPFGKPIGPRRLMGLFRNPDTLETIKVPGAGCSRFWIESCFGNLFPKIKDSLNLLHPTVAAAAEEIFGLEFAQGCRWG